MKKLFILLLLAAITCGFSNSAHAAQNRCQVMRAQATKNLKQCVLRAKRSRVKLATCNRAHALVKRSVTKLCQQAKSTPDIEVCAWLYKSPPAGQVGVMGAGYATMKLTQAVKAKYQYTAGACKF